MSASSADGGVAVVTHVIPASPTAAPHSRPEDKRRWPWVLGILQIIIGIIVCITGILMFPRHNSEMSIFAWQSVMLVTSGSLTAAAWNPLKHSLVKVALGFNVAAATVSGISTCSYLVDDLLHDNDPGPPLYYTEGYHTPSFQVPHGGVVLALIIFSVLGLIVSISLSAFAVKTLHRCTDQQPILTTNQSPKPASETPQTASTYEPTPVSQAPPPPDNTYERMKPPDYDTHIV